MAEMDDKIRELKAAVDDKDAELEKLKPMSVSCGLSSSCLILLKLCGMILPASALYQTTKFYFLKLTNKQTQNYVCS